jgi:hypothetical protein
MQVDKLGPDPSEFEAKISQDNFKSIDQQVRIDPALKSEALNRRSEKLLKGLIGFGVVGQLALGGGLVAGGSLFVFGGGTLVVASAFATGGASILASIAILLVILGYRYYKKEKQKRLEELKVENLPVIYAALGINNPEAITPEIEKKFEEDYGHSLQTIVEKASNVMAEICLNGDLTEYGGLKLGGIDNATWRGEGKWKYVIKLDPQTRKINALYLGQQRTYGSFTKIAFSPTKVVILIPRKTLRSETELIQARNNIEYLLNFYSESSPDAKKYLPPLPEAVSSFKIHGRRRHVMLALEAQPVHEIFQDAPKTGDEIIKRLKIIRDVASGVYYMHQANMTHGDIKPENMLVNAREGVGQPHDFGGCLIFNDNVDIKKAKEMQSHKIITSTFCHLQDYILARDMAKTKLTTISEVTALEKAGDVYALGISMMTALVGRKNKLFPSKSYKTVNNRLTFTNAEAPERIHISCIPTNWPIAKKINDFLDVALNKNYKERMLVGEFVGKLDDIITELEGMGSGLTF